MPRPLSRRISMTDRLDLPHLDDLTDEKFKVLMGHLYQ